VLVPSSPWEMYRVVHTKGLPDLSTDGSGTSASFGCHSRGARQEQCVLAAEDARGSLRLPNARRFQVNETREPPAQHRMLAVPVICDVVVRSDSRFRCLI
jgi:hypothetical protein